MTCNFAREPSDEQIGFNKLKSASVSRVPCKKSIGNFTLSRCSARLVPGLFGGCSGNPKNTSPCALSRRPCDAACEVILPPKDFPPASNEKPPATFEAARTAQATVAVATDGESGARRRCSMYGNWYRNVATPASASSRVNFSRNGCVIPAPAPCASAKSHRALAGRIRIAETSPASSTANRNRSDSAISQAILTNASAAFLRSPLCSPCPLC
jgi:hypothetical protein